MSTVSTNDAAKNLIEKYSNVLNTAVSKKSYTSFSNKLVQDNTERIMGMKEIPGVDTKIVIPNNSLQEIINDVIADKIIIDMDQKKYDESQAEAAANAYVENTTADTKFSEDLKKNIEEEFNRFADNTVFGAINKTGIIREKDKLISQITDKITGTIFTTETNKVLKQLDKLSKLDITREVNEQLKDITNIKGISEKLSKGKLTKFLAGPLEEAANKALGGVTGILSSNKIFGEIQKALLEVNKINAQVQAAAAAVQKLVVDITKAINSAVDQIYSTTMKIAKDIVSKISQEVGKVLSDITKEVTNIFKDAFSSAVKPKSSDSDKNVKSKDGSSIAAEKTSSSRLSASNIASYEEYKQTGSLVTTQTITDYTGNGKIVTDSSNNQEVGKIKLNTSTFSMPSVGNTGMSIGR